MSLRAEPHVSHLLLFFHYKNLLLWTIYLYQVTNTQYVVLPCKQRWWWGFDHLTTSLDNMSCNFSITHASCWISYKNLCAWVGSLHEQFKWVSSHLTGFQLTWHTSIMFYGEYQAILTQFGDMSREGRKCNPDKLICSNDIRRLLDTSNAHNKAFF